MSSGGIFIVAAKRTPFGAFGGALTNLSATQLGVESSKAALAEAQLDPALIDQCFVGSVLFSPHGAYLARHIALQSGCSHATPALTINRLCGSGFETVIQACNAIQLGQASVVMAGGTESMSQAPLVLNGQDVRFKGSVPLGKGLQMQDSLWDGLTDSHIKTPMGMTAENLAEQYNITRQECDEYSIRSQQLHKAAQDAGFFRDEMAPIQIAGRKGTFTTMDQDEHVRPDSTVESLAKLKPVFRKDGVVTAANASGICDGAGTILVASEQAVLEHNLQPLCRIVSHAVTGCDPSIMGIGPVQAIQKALSNSAAPLDLHKDIDRVEINEAFAAQTLACIKELKLDLNKTNIHGGAISLGHPLGASGSRILAHLAHEFKYNANQKTAVGSACIGGGQGIAVVLERV